MTCAVHTDQVATAYCRTCGKALCQTCQRDVRGVIYCQDCLAARLEGTVPPAAANTAQAVYTAPVSNASPGLAAVLGFIPGVGAFYNGQFAKGFVHVFIFALIAHLASRGGDFFGWCVPAWILYMVFDAYSTAKARMLGQPLPDHLGLNALLAGFGLGTPTHPTPAVATAGGAPVSAVPTGSSDVGSAPIDPAVASSSVANFPYSTEETGKTASCGGVMPVGAMILIALGVLLLLDNLGVLSFRWLGEFWPILLIALGLWLAVRRMGRNRA